MAPQDCLYVFSRVHLFPSPSQAAMALMGRSANGWVEVEGRQRQDAGRVEAAGGGSRRLTICYAFRSCLRIFHRG